ncbi:zinc finger SWIM domain protein [Halogeometricum pallidum JCM 14848]|uniref:Zinc finger SWIM domain protein n=1 Tax=Halogeometricum pallidum JCM 14848 TaxID=1227487 RepID=M0CUY1_HALPD|nr:SWIM zinc finger family protein [Halogeometricum pallidum]ELZ27046.1 zinc finger SWIM domain protein [Halogeometricum pallidum JCM 14848]
MTRTHPLNQLEFSKRVGKRAQYEAFEFTLLRNAIRVTNASYADPENHTYEVDIEDGLPARCTCPADERFEGACKHRVAIAIRRPLLQAMTLHRDEPVVADGGQQHGTLGSKTEADESCLECLDDFPCWECVKTGRRELPDDRHER